MSKITRLLNTLMPLAEAEPDDWQAARRFEQPQFAKKHPDLAPLGATLRCAASGEPNDFCTAQSRVFDVQTPGEKSGRRRCKDHADGAAFAGIERLGQVLVSEKSIASGPAIVMLVIFSGVAQRATCTGLLVLSPRTSAYPATPTGTNTTSANSRCVVPSANTGAILCIISGTIKISATILQSR